MSSVCVVGIGVCVPGGASVQEFAETIRRAENSPSVERWQHDRVSCVFRADSTRKESEMLPHELRRLDRCHLLALQASAEAMDNLSGLLPDPDRCGVSAGTGFGGWSFAETQMKSLLHRGPRAVSPLSIPLAMPSSVASILATEFGFHGPVIGTSNACSSGAVAIGEAVWKLRTSQADFMLAGGADALLTDSVLAGFDRLAAMSRSTDEPELASRPFDVNRDGFVLGEGAAFVALMRSEDARASGVRRYGAILGYGSTSDAAHLVAPDQSGTWAADAMRQAIRDAGMVPGEIGHVNAHGTSTPLNDAAESSAIDSVFGAGSIPVTSTKGVTGHLIGASGAAEVVASLRACEDLRVPQVGGLRDPDPALQIDAVVGESRAIGLPTAVSNSFAFGGHNCAIVVSA